MPNSKVLEIVIKAKDEATKTLNGLNDTLKNNEANFKRMATAGTVAFAGLSAGIAKLVKDGAESASIAESFNRMTKDVGLDADQLITKLEEVSASTVSQTDLMLASNKAMALGVGKDMDTMTTLMEIARVKGRALGLDTTQAFNDIVTGIGRGSPLILDNLGITIKLGEAQEMYAEKLGKTVDQLTEEEKKQSLLNAVLESGRRELELVGDVTLTTSERFQQLKKEFSDTASRLGEALLPTVERAIEVITPMLEKVATWIEENPKMATTILLVTTAVAGLVAVIGALGLAIPVIVTGFGLITPAVLLVTGIIGGLTWAVFNVTKALYLLQHESKTIWSGIKIIFKEAIDGIIDFFQPLINVINNIIARLESIGSTVKSKVTGAINKLKGRATGGGVSVGQQYVVGENGPELFSPATTGSIIPNRNLSTTAGMNITINMNGGTYLSDEVVEDIGDRIITNFKRVARI